MARVSHGFLAPKSVDERVGHGRTSLFERLETEESLRIAARLDGRLMCECLPREVRHDLAGSALLAAHVP